MEVNSAIQREKDREVLCALKKRKRKHFRGYVKAMDLSNEQDAWVVTQIFPVRMWFFWHMKALLCKLGI